MRTWSSSYLLYSRNSVKKATFTSGYHRLHAAWFLNFHLASRTFALLDTTGFMPCGDSVSAYVVQKKKVELMAAKAEIEAPRGIKPVVSWGLSPYSLG
jgi:hypothetical protein